MTNELVNTRNGELVEATPAMSITEVKQQVNLIQQVMREVMQKTQHYGTIPGCGDKPALFKAGAEKLTLTFRLAPSYRVDEKAQANGHREYNVVCELTHIDTRKFLGSGVGVCSTMEKKYRYRTRWENNKKVQEENPDIADTYNTVLKMAKKRALVDAVLSTTAASDIFTQDIDETVTEVSNAKPEIKTPKAAEGPTQSTDSEPVRGDHAPVGAQDNEIPFGGPPAGSSSPKAISEKQLGLLMFRARTAGVEEAKLDSIILATFGKKSKKDLTTGELNKLLIGLDKKIAEATA